MMTQPSGTGVSSPASPRAGAVYLTQEAFDRLANELEVLKTEGRERVSQAIGVAREHGDIRENADYDAAKNEQGMMEARIRQIESILRSAVVGEAVTDGTAGPGTVVTLEIAGEEESYFIGSREEAIDGMDVLSTKSPLGQAVTGRSPGEEFTYLTPAGREISCKLVRVEQRR
jgi:transcription elongation factor GreA